MREKRRTLRTAWLISILGMMSLWTLWANEYWDKPFTQWNEREAVAMLSESPWARTQNVVASALKAGKSESGRAADLPRPVGPGMTSGSGISQTGVSWSDNDSIPVQTRWYSARKIRQALGRLAQLKGGVPEDELNKFLTEPLEDYLICMEGPLMETFNQATLESLRDSTFLLSKKNITRKLQLKKYTVPKDRRDGIALFSFPRFIDGKPVFDPSDEEIQFVTRVNKLGVKVGFKLSRMMVDGALDL